MGNIEETIKFPEKMLFGTGSAAYQVEGGWDADGKSPSIWDNYFHSRRPMASNPYLVKKTQLNIDYHRGSKYNSENRSKGLSVINGDIACDSYNQVDEDIKNLIDVGVNVYRFSISWPRILPQGDSRFPNEAGVNYYKDLIQKLLDNNIQPMVTMYHWDLPKIFQELGGWANPNLIDYYSNYVTFLFETFGEQVKLWCTINEPRMLALGYSNNPDWAPAIGNTVYGVGEYMAWHNLLLAHSAAYKIYKNSFKAQQQGEICISVDTGAYAPEDPSVEEHRLASAKAYDFNIGILVQPLITGEYPKSVVDAVENTNEHENIKIQRLKTFTDEQKEDLIGSYDFIGINYYSAYKIRPLTSEEYENADDIKTKDMGFVADNDDDIENTFKGFAEVIEWFVDKCNNPTLFITENGIDEKPNQDESQKKIHYHYGILTELYKLIKKGVDIKGYTMWSFMDSLEWSSGYFQKLYGIYSVDFNDPKRPRSKKPSFEFFQQLFKTKTLPSITQ